MVFRVLSLIPGLRQLTGDPRRDAALRLYASLVEQARAPIFYTDMGVPDTTEGRFEMLALHVFAVMRRLKREGDGERGYSQALFDVMFEDMDDSLREQGVGDTVVGKKVRGLAEDFFGRVAAYDAPLHSGDAEPLVAALSRNVYEAEAAPGAVLLADYMRRLAMALDDHAAADILRNELNFPPPLSENLS